jgi:hypothetical protein
MLLDIILNWLTAWIKNINYYHNALCSKSKESFIIMVSIVLLLGVKQMRISENALNEIEQELCSYLLNVDDLIYTMLCEPLIRHKSAVTPKMPSIGGLEKISLVNELTHREENLEYMELIDVHSQMEFPKRKFQQVRPAILEDELVQNY